MNRILLLLALAAVLAWRGVDSGLHVIRDLAAVGAGDLADAWTLPEEERVRRELRDLAARAGLPTEHYAAIVEALRQHVPTDAVVLVLSRDPAHRVLTYSFLTVLLFPRRFHLSEGPPPGWEALAAPLGRRFFVLEYRSPPDPTLRRALQELAGGDDWRLLRQRTESGR